MIEELTPEQEALIPVYQEKWRAIALSTEPFDHKTASSIAATYIKSTQEDLDFFLFDSPYAVLEQSLTKIENHLWKPSRQSSLLQRQLAAQIQKQVEKELWRKINRQLRNDMETQLWSQLWSRIQRQLWEQALLENRNLLELSNLPYLALSPTRWINAACLFDFCISVLGCKSDLMKWEIFQLVARYLNAGVFSFKNALIGCASPTQLCFDNEQRLHAEGSPAIQFTDGYSLYLYHGVMLPEKYGRLQERQWEAQWLLTEQNAELRRVLIQGIGYGRITYELQAEELDKWQEYSLLKIENVIDIEPIYLLKMQCPSTGRIHVLRVPPDVRSARQAIGWINWGVAPEEFSVQA